MAKINRQNLFRGMLSLTISTVSLLIVLLITLFGLGATKNNGFKAGTVKPVEENQVTVDDKKKEINFVPTKSGSKVDLATVFTLPNKDDKATVVGTEGENYLSLDPEKKSYEVDITVGGKKKRYTVTVDYKNLLFVYKATKGHDGNVQDTLLGSIAKAELNKAENNQVARLDLLRKIVPGITGDKFYFHRDKTLLPTSEFPIENNQAVLDGTKVYVHSLIAYEVEVYFQSEIKNDNSYSKQTNIVSGQPTSRIEYGEAGQEVTIDFVNYVGLKPADAQSSVRKGVLKNGEKTILKLFYDRVLCDVILYYNHPTNQGFDKIQVKYGGKISDSDIQTGLIPNTVFTGLARKADNTSPFDYHTTPIENFSETLTLYYIWNDKPVKGKIETYYEDLQTSEYLKGSDVLLENLPAGKNYNLQDNQSLIPEREGFQVKWDHNDAVYNLTVAEEDNQTVFKLYFSRKTFKVTWNVNGGKFKHTNEQTFENYFKFGAKIIEPEIPTRANHIFKGWSVEGIASTFNFEDPQNTIKKDMTFVCLWEEGEESTYYMEYYYETTQLGVYPAVPETRIERRVKTNSPISIEHKHREGFIHDESEPGNVLSGLAVANTPTVLKAFYKRRSYDVAFDIPAGAYPESIDTVKGQLFGTEVINLKPVSYEGFTFIGWSTEKNNPDKIVKNPSDPNDTRKFIMPAHDVTLYAVFTRENYDLKLLYYVQDEASVGLTPTYKSTAVKAITIPKVPFGTYQIPNEYIYNLQGLEGYHISASSLINTTVNNTKQPNEQFTRELKLYYDKNVYTVNWDLNKPSGITDQIKFKDGGDLNASEVYNKVYHGLKITNPPSDAVVDTGSGYKFAFWSTNKDALYSSQDDIFRFGDVTVFENTTLYAIYAPLAGGTYYTEEYWVLKEGKNPNGATSDDFDLLKRNVITSTAGQNVTINPLTGEDANGLTSVNVAGTDGTKLTGVVVGDGSLVLKGFYVQKDFTLNYFLDGGEPLINQQTIRYRHKLESFPNTSNPLEGDYISKAGHEFKFWSDNADPTNTPINLNDFRMPARNVVLKANWERTTFKVTVKYLYEHEDIDGEYVEDDTLREILHLPLGQYNASDKPKIGFERHSDNVYNYTITNDREINLRYKRKLIKVVYDANGGSFKNNYNPNDFEGFTDVKFGRKFSEALPAAYNPERLNSEFKHWSTTQVDGPAFNFLTGRVDKEDFRLYAIYNTTVAKYDMVYYIQNVNNNGYSIYKATSKLGSVGTSVTMPVAIEGDSFLDNYFVHTDSPLGFTPNPTGFVTPAGDLVLTRYYNRKLYEVTFDLNDGRWQDTNGAWHHDLPKQTVKFQSSVADPSETHTIVRQGFTLTGWLNVTLNQTFTFGVDEIKDNTALKAIWKGEENIPYRLVLEYEDKDTEGLDLVSRPANRNMNLTAGIQKTFTLNEFLTYFNDLDVDALLLDKSIEPTRVRDKNPSVPRIINVDPIQKTITVMIDPSVSGYSPSDNQITVKLLVRRHTYTFELHEGTGLNNLTNLIAGRTLLNQAEHISQDPVRPGYRFLGFKKDINSSTLYTREQINNEPVMSDLTLHAIWEAIVHKVTFETLNGSVIDEVTLTGAPEAVEEQNIAHNSLLDNTNDKLFLTSQSHVFKYWSETEGGAEFDVKTQPILKDMKLYAVWEAKVFRVSFATGTPDIIVPDQHVKWGKEATDPRTTGTEMVRDGFVFRFFSLSANGSTGEYQFSNKVYLETEIFAIWEEKTRMFGEYSNAFVMKGQKLYAAGENGNGQLGLGHKDLVKKFTLVSKERYFNKNIKQIAPAKYATLMLTSDNELYAVGANDKGQLGLGYNGEDILNWTNIPKSSYNNEMIKEIYGIGQKTFAFVTENNKIYTWGLNEKGVIGTDDDNYDNFYNKPTQISPSLFDNKQIKKIIIGVGHGAIITADDSLYLWGYNDSYEFILKDKLYYNKPTLIPNSNYDNKAIKDVVLSSSNVFYIMQDGTIYTAGFNLDGRMGIGNEASLLNAQRILTLLDYLPYTSGKRIVKIHSKMAGTYFYTEDGKIYYAGSWNGGGQGISSMIAGNFNVPTLVNVNVEGVSNTIVDTRIIYFSSFVLTSDGTVLAAGNNDYGQLGIDSEEQKTPFFHKCIFQD